MKADFIKAVQFLDRSRNILISLLIGGMTGAVIMLFFAPQSGRKTRSQVFHKRFWSNQSGQLNDAPAAMD